LDYVKRAQWGARPPRSKRRTYLSKAAAKGMGAHYEAVDREGIEHGDCIKVVQGIQRYHQDNRGWDDIAYSFLVCRHGRIWEGRGWGVRTAANGTSAANDAYHAVCYMDDDTPGIHDVTPEALSALTVVIEEGQKLGWGADVKPHSHFKRTACPGDELRYWIAMEGWKKPQKAPESGATPSQGCYPSGGASGPHSGTHAPSWYRRVLRVQNPMLRGSDVAHVQRVLKADADGIYGPATEAKVRGFQRLHGLTADGVVGPKTASKLAEVYG
jgi:murein L,D-transpeptidase YcbB/YkuD